MAGRRLTGPPPTEDDLRLVPRLDRLLLLFVALQLIVFVTIPLGPLAVAGIATLGPLRRSRPRLICVWALGAALAAIVVAPLWFGTQLVHESPTYTV